MSVSEQFIVYDGEHNKTRIDEKKGGGWVKQHAPALPKYSEEWRLHICIRAVGGWEAAREITILYRQGVSIDDLKIRYGLASATCIYTILRYYGVQLRKKRRKRRPLSQEELEQIRQLYQSGASIYSIAKRLGRSPFLILYHLKKMGLK